jgi:hypothetical protein
LSATALLLARCADFASRFLLLTFVSMPSRLHFCSKSCST